MDHVYKPDEAYDQVMALTGGKGVERAIDAQRQRFSQAAGHPLHPGVGQDRLCGRGRHLHL